MSKYELIDIDENSLPPISLSYNELNLVTYNLLENIDKLSKVNDKVNINTDMHNVLNSISSVDTNCPSTLHGVKNANILKDLVVQAIENDLNISDKDILFKEFFLTGGGKEHSIPSSYYFVGGSYYYQVYLTRTELIIFALNEDFKLINNWRIPIKNIEDAAVLDTNLDGDKLDYKYLITHVNIPNTNITSFYFVAKSYLNPNSLETFVETLKILGVKEYKLGRRKINIYFYASLIVSFILIVFYILRYYITL